jgi:phosphopantothenoylcysteine decarboxylase/phosphopantothenate--cysteine ligase
MLTTTALACRNPILVAPAMETGMWDNPATRANLQILGERGVYVVGPAEGLLASGASGIGRMSEPDELFRAARWVMSRRQPMTGVRVVVSAGGTQEAIDPVRFIGNHSSGKMGYALAQAASDRGADVVLIHGPTSLGKVYGVEDVAAESAEKMHIAVLEAVSDADALIMAAAVADSRDILAAVAEHRDQNNRLKAVIGFAAETESLVANARDKLTRKRLDFIVANDVSTGDSGFCVDTNRVTLIDSAGKVDELPLLQKQEVAEIIIDRLMGLIKRN